MKNIFDEFGIFDPLTAGREFGMSCRFKGGGGAKPPSPNIADTPTAKWARQNLYPLYARGMEGKGLLPANLSSNLQDERDKGLASSYQGAKDDLNSDLSRMLSSKDSGARLAFNNALNRGHRSMVDSERRMQNARNVSDKEQAANMATTAVGNEMRMGISGMQSYNAAQSQQAANEAQYGTMGQNVAGGLGAAMTSLYFAKGMSA